MVIEMWVSAVRTLVHGFDLLPTDFTVSMTTLTEYTVTIEDLVADNTVKLGPFPHC